MLPPVEGAASYYADIAQQAMTLACQAPAGPPRGAADLMRRLDPGWLAQAWAGDPGRLAAADAAARHLPDVLMRMRTLLERLGPGFEGNGRLGDADAWYFILEGTREKSVAEAQAMAMAMAITELIAHAATGGGRPREIMLAVDDYSAVVGRVPLADLYERGRSLGLAVQVSAQSWHGLGGSEDERQRIAATADGGIWLMRTPAPDQISRLAGTRRIIETAWKLVGSIWGDEGSSRVQHAWTADPGIARRLAVGQAGYIRAGTCVWVQIARPVPSPLSLTASPARQPEPEPAPEAARQPGRRQAIPLPRASLDDVFGPARDREPGRP